jgi:ATP-binding cassette subfamily F protein uup
MGQLETDSGKIQVGETVIFGYYSQEGMNLAEDKRVIEIVKDVAEVIPLANGTNLSASQFLQLFLFPPEMQYTYVSKLSGGEKRRLYLLTVLMKNPNFLILDEPTNDLDLETIELLETKLSEFQGAIILISHDRAFLSTVTNKVWMIENKKLQNFEGGYEQVAPYLEVIELEREVAQEARENFQVSSSPPSTAQELSKASNSKISNSKISNKDKKRLEVIYDEIESTETKTQIIQDKIANLDYTKLSDPKNQELKILTDAQNFLEEKLLSLYQELEDLEAKNT